MDANKPAPQGHGIAVEPDRVSTRIVVTFGIAVLMIALFRTLDRGAGKMDEKLIAAAGLQRRESAPPPLPRLQIYPVKHWKDFQAAERERLTTYGWMDRGTGVVHIPIDRAIDLIAERGVAPLPAGSMVAPQAAGPGNSGPQTADGRSGAKP